ncbi:transcriptional regulator, IclR family [Brevibacterium siliguriense]|uniref:Transcriptional regulator, IclR family n=1 Tax=Brevibacterium siliguriense TaxID=1136497 RepID=A0A1H1W3Q3_9MICO|nr:IclR family transcriptional regulator [Brevibacterium siliguriense]SDS91767.1 transcriptional regulator, IclR family [Brevibacterium siliguriense]
MATQKSPMRSLERAIDVLEILDSSRGPLRLNEIARRAELPVATTQRILAVLESRDRVERDSNGYRPGIALTFGAHAFSTTNPLIRAARPVLIELASLTGLTSTLYREHNGQRVALSRAGIARNFGYELVVGSRLPLTTGGGKAILAQLDDESIRALCEESSMHDNTPDLHALLDDVSGIRARGFSISREEREPGVASVASAVPAEYGILAAIQITGTIDDFPEEKTHSMGRQVRQAAISIGHGLPESHPF